MEALVGDVNSRIQPLTRFFFRYSRKIESSNRDKLYRCLYDGYLPGINIITSSQGLWDGRREASSSKKISLNSLQGSDRLDRLKGRPIRSFQTTNRQMLVKESFTKLRNYDTSSSFIFQYLLGLFTLEKVNIFALKLGRGFHDSNQGIPRTTLCLKTSLIANRVFLVRFYP